VATVFLFFFASTWAFGKNMHKFAREKGILKSNQKLFFLEWIVDYTVILVYNALL
jgi:hypothetical protein